MGIFNVLSQLGLTRTRKTAKLTVVLRAGCHPCWQD